MLVRSVASPRALPTLVLESFDDNLREQAAYNQKALRSNNQKIWDHLAKWYGIVETNIGRASETELIRNNNKIAETLEEYLFREGLTDEIKDAIEAPLYVPISNMLKFLSF